MQAGYSQGIHRQNRRSCFCSQDGAGFGNGSTLYRSLRPRLHDRAFTRYWLASLHDGKRGTRQVSQGAPYLGRHQPLLDVRGSVRAFTTTRTRGRAGAFPTTRNRGSACAFRDPKSRQRLPPDPKSIAAASISPERNVNIRHVSREDICRDPPRLAVVYVVSISTASMCDTPHARHSKI